MAGFDKAEFVDTCVGRSISLGVWPEYVLAVAQARSKIEDLSGGDELGPFGLTKAQWNANLKDPDGVEDFEPGDIEDWRMHCQVFPAMTSRDQTTLQKKLGRLDFSMVELYCAQFPAVTPEKATGDLTTALLIVAPLVEAARKKLKQEQPVITDPTKPLPVGGFGPGPFNVKAPLVMKQLLKDFPEFNKVHAAAILGNIFVESAGFTAFHEKGLPFEKGGIGWCQWTGRPGRRQDFEKFCETEKLEIRSDEASYKFMVHEMRNTPEKAVVKPLSLKTDLDDATEFFMKKYERPGTEHLAQRQKGAKIALDAFDAGG